jgi:hypothetical protein
MQRSEPQRLTLLVHLVLNILPEMQVFKPGLAVQPFSFRAQPFGLRQSLEGGRFYFLDFPMKMVGSHSRSISIFMFRA